MLDNLNKGIDSGKLAGALLTYLFKAFDCLNHELLIAASEPYGFDPSSLSYIYNYLSDRKQRTKVNNSCSSWSNIKSGDVCMYVCTDVRMYVCTHLRIYTCTHVRFKQPVRTYVFECSRMFEKLTFRVNIHEYYRIVFYNKNSSS